MLSLDYNFIDITLIRYFEMFIFNTQLIY